MPQPLSPLSPSDQNLKSPSTVERKSSSKTLTSYETESYVVKTHFEQDENEDEDLNGPPSSPFIANVDLETQSPRKSQSPSKHRSPTKASPTKRHAPALLTEEALKRNDNLTRSVEIYEDDSGVYYDGENKTQSAAGAPQGYDGMDDTCFSTFSAVPNADMTLFAKIGQSPSKSNAGSPAKQLRHAQYQDHATPRPGATTPSTARRRVHDDSSPSPSPTPRRTGTAEGADTTNLILDFTEQFNAFSSDKQQISPSRSRRPGPSKYHTQSELSAYASGRRTPSSARRMLPPSTPSQARHLAHLLDFDIPPAPTPRSVPSITARELESLKSSYLSQISSMKANLSGKEAEVNSLKEAVGDAERRVGEALEEVREERGAKESLQADKADWEKRGKNMEDVLRNVKEEIIRGEREREELARKLEESECRREEAEMKVMEAECRIAGMRAGSGLTVNGSDTGTSRTDSSAEVDAAVLQVSKELHTAYKSKHESKVAALRKSYEGRWDKKVKDLENQLAATSKENEELRIGRDATLSGVVPGTLLHEDSAERQQEKAEEKAEEARKVEEQEGKVAGLMEEVAKIQRDNSELRNALEKEQMANVALAAAAEEIMLLVPETDDTQAPPAIENFRGSVSRASGLKGPGFSSSIGNGESRIGRMNSGGNSIRSMSGSGMGTGRSGIMSNIERMGRGRGID
ncbi:MAG: hypothetical protein M1830_005531 [Pleopsidium flavum]|nr:MAG: hypothetical protein M1830_005531 [Pleopsidium flavum]